MYIFAICMYIWFELLSIISFIKKSLSLYDSLTPSLRFYYSLCNIVSVE